VTGGARRSPQFESRTALQSSNGGLAIAVATRASIFVVRLSLSIRKTEDINQNYELCLSLHFRHSSCLPRYRSIALTA
jgi:hypothetical protein